jgi:hypothetical protein
MSRVTQTIGFGEERRVYEDRIRRLADAVYWVVLKERTPIPDQQVESLILSLGGGKVFGLVKDEFRAEELHMVMTVPDEVDVKK